MHLSQSVVLWQGRGCIQKIAIFAERPSLYFGKNSSNKQRVPTIHHCFKTWRSVNPENFKNFESAVAKTINHYDEAGFYEDCHRKGRSRVTSAAEDKFIIVNCEDTTTVPMRWFGMNRTAEWRKCSQQVLSICGNSFKTVGKAFQVKLVERIQRVCKAVIKAKGGYFEEFQI